MPIASDYSTCVVVSLTGKGTCQRPDRRGETMRGDGHGAAGVGGGGGLRWAHPHRYRQSQHRVLRRSH